MTIRIAVLSPISWRTPPRHYGPWETVVGLLTEELVQIGLDVTLFASGDSQTVAKLIGVCPRPYSEDPSVNPKVAECLHISEVFERAADFDLIHNHFDFLPLTYSDLTETPVLTTIHGFSSPSIIPVYKKYNAKGYYVAISEADKSPELNYLATIHHGIDIAQFPFSRAQGQYLLFFGRIHPDKGVYEAIQVAQRVGMKLVIAGIVQDQEYFENRVEPYIDGETVEYLGAVDPGQRRQVLGQALALLHLINFDEPFGLSLVESMACGTPVIAFGRGSIPEIIQHGVTGYIVDGINQVVEAVGEVSSIDRHDCRAHVQKYFSCRQMARNYLKAYQQILDARENYRPWGHYQNLTEAEDFKVKQITVLPGKRLSLQKHRRRAEHWIVTRGTAVVTVDGREIPLTAGQSVDIRKGSTHRIFNPGSVPLVFVETQLGDYFGEDDIIRLEDDFGRA